MFNEEELHKQHILKVSTALRSLLTLLTSRLEVIEKCETQEIANDFLEPTKKLHRFAIGQLSNILGTSRSYNELLATFNSAIKYLKWMYLAEYVPHNIIVNSVANSNNAESNNEQLFYKTAQILNTFHSIKKATPYKLDVQYICHTPESNLIEQKALAEHLDRLEKLDNMMSKQRMTPRL